MWSSCSTRSLARSRRPSPSELSTNRAYRRVLPSCRLCLLANVAFLLSGCCAKNCRQDAGATTWPRRGEDDAVAARFPGRTVSQGIAADLDYQYDYGKRGVMVLRG